MELCSITGLKGKVTVPGDKSISHRCIMFGSIADGTTEMCIRDSINMVYNVFNTFER